MGRVQSTQGFNKEQLVFLAVSAIAALSTYWYLASGPVELEVGRPIAAGEAPKPLSMKPPPDPLEEKFYVMDGKITNLMDPKTGQAVNRQRKTPFMAASAFKERVTKPKDPVNLTPPPPPPPEAPKETKEEKRDFGPQDVIAEIEFMGVITLNNKTYGLVRPKDGSSPKRVKVGDKLPDYNYTVTRIDKQAIHVEDEEKRPFVLRDTDEIEGGDESEDKPKREAKSKAAKTEKPSTPTGKARPNAPTTQTADVHGGNNKGGRDAMDQVLDEALRNPDEARKRFQQKVDERIKEMGGPRRGRAR
jgi:Tfp pilus assembly protein PilP